jgi:uncharacterized damage-inducible protein DinB
MIAEREELAVLARYAEGPEQLERALAGLDDAGLDARVSQNGWTVRQTVHHIVDGDDLWKLCIKSALGTEDGEFTLEWYGKQPQDVWADRWKYSERSVDVSLALFRANRHHVLQLLKHVPDAWQRSIRMRTADGQSKRVTVGTAMQIQADHAMHHIGQIDAVRATPGSS